MHEAANPNLGVAFVAGLGLQGQFGVRGNASEPADATAKIVLQNFIYRQENVQSVNLSDRELCPTLQRGGTLAYRNIRMSAALMEAQLLGMLRVDPDLSARGCTVERQAIGGITITHGEHHLGLWAWQAPLFTFTPGGYGAPSFKIENAVEALLYTRNIVCPARS